MKTVVLRSICIIASLLCPFSAAEPARASADVSASKIAPAVRTAIRGSSARRTVLVLTSSAAPLQGMKARAARIPKDLPRAIRVEATPAQIQKLADSPDVIAIVPDEPPPLPPVPGPQMHPGLAQASGTVPLPNTWKASELVGARAAWDLGYTGYGVKVAVIDERIDFGHPDLQGAQARAEDPASPYYGWPLVFDPQSMAMYAATGRTSSTGYVSTLGTVHEDNPVIGSTRVALPHTSKSGVYRYGGHPSYWLRWLTPFGRSVLVLVADEHVPGIYDTAYVDLDKDYDFTDEKPCRRGDEIAWHDLDGDGIADLSGGMVYFIADGVNPIPASDWLYNLPPPANGSLVCFTGSFDKYESHGTLVASAIAAQGVIGAGEPAYRDIGGGIVRGTAPGARIISIGNVYDYGASMYDAILFAVLGYDGIPNTGDEADVANMSFGYSTIDNDGWDYLSRYITYLNVTQAPHTTFVAATGNGGPGYGTVTSPGSAPSAVSVGASTLYGSVPLFDDIASADQILFGDIQPWSNRGPSALGVCEPDVAAIGAWATGDLPIFGDGANSWGVWGGTSLSSPMAAGVLAAVYQAYAETHGVRPTYAQARNLLMAGASDLHYLVLEQGAGQVNAEASVRIALGQEPIASPASWEVNQTALGFPGSVIGGEKVTRAFTVTNPGQRMVKLDISSETYVRTSEFTFEITAENALESSEMVGPSYLIDLLTLIPQGTDLLRVRAAMPFEQFSLGDPTSRDMNADNAFALVAYDWTDLNSDGVLWHDDMEPNGVVNEGELDEHELNRFTYDAAVSDCLQVSVQSPLTRYHDGLLLGLQHYLRSEDIPTTDIKLTLEFYKRADWDMLNVNPSRLVLGPGRSGAFRAVFSTKRSRAPGLYSGAIRVKGESAQQIIPVTALVTNYFDSRRAEPIVVSGSDGLNAPYDNGVIRGAFDWSWRAESGDWRSYLYTPPQSLVGQAVLLANVNWRYYPTDVDALLFGPDRSNYFSLQLPQIFGPYSLTPTGGSWPTNLGGAVWPFFTNTGGPSEWVSAPLGDGAHLALLHSVLSAGISAGEPIDTSIGPAIVTPAELEVPAGTSSTRILSLTPYLPLREGLGALAYGFSPVVELTNQTARQDPIDSPDSASWRYDIALADAGLLEVETSSASDIDIDLYVIRDANGDGYFDWNTEMVAFSGDSSANEKISIPLPADGRYRIAVHGYWVRPSPSTFDISINAIQGRQISVDVPAGPVAPGQTVPIQVRAVPDNLGEGIIYLGPQNAPAAMHARVRAR